ncbi:MAG: glycosyltransferase family 39 protein [Chloroflexota bacterium]
MAEFGAAVARSARSRAGRRSSVWYDMRADVMPLLLLLFGAIVLRVAFFTSAPPLLNPDSAGYYVPARNLVYGDGFDLGLRRTPTYPLFVAAVVSFVGEDLQALVTVQHFLFGPLLVVLTYLLGRLAASRLTAILASVLVMVSGPLLLYEHYVMTEVPFAILLLASLSTTILATRRASLRWAAATGLLFGLLVLCRPSGQILAPLIGGTLLLLMPAPWSRRLAALGVLAACALVVVVPWMAYNRQTQGAFVIAGSGRFLLARTLKMDPGGFTFETPPGVVETGTQAAARRIVQEEAAKTKPASVAQRFRDELGLSDAEAYPLMQGFALQAIRNRPIYFVTSTIEAFTEIVLGEPIAIRREGVPLADADFERRARGALRKPVYPLDSARAQPLVSIYDPSRYGWTVPILFALGMVVALLRARQRWLLLPALATLALIGGSAALVGGELRYRFPQEPLIALVLCGGLVGLAELGLGLARRRRDRARETVAA